MPEPISTPAIEPTPVDAAAELAVLKAAHQEVLAKRQKDKARIAELEAAMTENQSKLNEANESLHEVTVKGPLRQMAESISTVPDLWIEQFSKSHKLVMVKGQLAVQSIDGKPLAGVQFERKSLMDHLTADTHPQSKTFKHISIASKASGASSSHLGQTKQADLKPTHQFGLR